MKNKFCHNETDQHVTASEYTGATIVEMLVAITLLFIAITVALRLQVTLADNLGTRQLDRAVVVADSLMVVALADSALVDSTYERSFHEAQLHVAITVATVGNLRTYRIILSDQESQKTVHTIYYEEEIPQKAR